LQQRPLLAMSNALKSGSEAVGGLSPAKRTRTFFVYDALATPPEDPP
jgi:hypothetical protein